MPYNHLFDKYGHLIEKTIIEYATGQLADGPEEIVNKHFSRCKRCKDS